MTVVDLFAGVGGFSLAFERAGFRTVAFSEIEPFPCRVLAHHWPAIPNLGDVTQIDGREIVERFGPIDVVTGGWPCQDVSVAGKRAGLAGVRSGLFYEMIRVVREMREASDGAYPTFLVGENVPGLLSSHGGRDVARVLAAVAELGPLDIGWRVLDAQYHGVPQRRRRVFFVVDFGKQRAGEILALSESVRRHPAPRRETGKGVARPLAAGAPGSSGDRNDADTADNLIACPLTANYGKQPDNSDSCPPNLIAHCFIGATRIDAETETLVAEPQTFDWQASCAGDESWKGKGRSYIVDPPGRTRALNAQKTLAVAHSLRADGFDASEDGTGRGTPLVPIGFNARQDPVWAGVTGPLDTNGGTQAVAFAENSRAELRLENGDGQRTGALSTGDGKMGQGVPAVAFASETGQGWWSEREPTLRAENTTSKPNCMLSTGVGVRRLTPRECERLQGFPDDWTAIPGAADGPRYRALGNSVALPVVEWIARRIAAVLARDRSAA